MGLIVFVGKEMFKSKQHIQQYHQHLWLDHDVDITPNFRILCFL